MKYHVQKKYSDVLHDAHLVVGQVRQNKMIKETQTNYKNIIAKSMKL